MLEYNKDVDKKFKAFLWVVATLLFVTSFLSYYRYMISQDFTTRLDESEEEVQVDGLSDAGNEGLGEVDTPGDGSDEE